MWLMMGNFRRETREGGSCGWWNICVHMPSCESACYNQTIQGKHTSQAAHRQTFNSQWRTSVFLLFSSKWRNLLACALSVIHTREHRFAHWLQTFLLRQLLDPWAVFRFPTNPGPVLAPQPRRTQLESHRHALTSPHLALIFQGSLWSR